MFSAVRYGGDKVLVASHSPDPLFLMIITSIGDPPEGEHQCVFVNCPVKSILQD